jgi:peptide/nickel transport system permease protein
MTLAHAERPSGESVVPAPRRRNPYVTGLGSPGGVAGLTLIGVVLLTGILGPVFLSYGPLQQGTNALAGAGSGGNLLGTDEFGRDLLARGMAGIRVDALVAVVAVPVAAVAGSLLGMLSGLHRRAGGAVQRLFDILLGFPGIVMGIAVGIAMSPGRNSVIVAVVLVTMPAFGRQTRLTTLSQLSRDYVSAATVAGTPRWQIILRHVAPNIVDAVLVRAAVAVAQAIQIEGGLSVIGLGIQPPRASLGSMISAGSPYLDSHPLYSLVPVAVVFMLVLGFTMLADALNKAVLRR